MALITTPTHWNADSYVSLKAANDYFDCRSVEAWANANSKTKEAFLRLATIQVDAFRFFGVKLFPVAAHYRKQQKLEFPRTNERLTTGTVTSATANTIVDNSLISKPEYPTDLWKNGALIIIEGTGRGQTISVDSFDPATGTVTVKDNFATIPDSTSQYYLLEETCDAIQYAVLEQVAYLINGGGKRQAMIAEGVKEFQLGDLSETYAETAKRDISLSNEARGHLKGLISRTGCILR